ncbi:hypothetical protein ISS08_00220 [Candidatus Pacearchaeota archaeon]|nr:hypothetical protein [Candidatus Pacearchaeota archaeon]
MKIQQMAFMLMALMLFFGLVSVFIISFQIANLKGSAAQLEEKEALLLVSKLANSPEFSCGNSFDKPRAACVDLDKVMALKNKIGNYEDFWGISGIEIRRVFPELNSEVECTRDDYTDWEACNLITLFSSEEGTAVENFVALCRKDGSNSPSYNKCEIGKLIVVYDTQ